MMRKIKIATATLSVVALGAVSSAAATGVLRDVIVKPGSGETSVQVVQPASEQVLRELSALRSESSQIASADEQQTLRNSLGGDAIDHGPIANADFSHAVVVPVKGSSIHGWLVPSGDKACLVLPDPENGYGASCAGVEEIKAGAGLLMIGPAKSDPDGLITVATIVADGGAAPTLTAAGKGTSRLSVAGNVAAAALPQTGALDTGPGPIDLAKIGSAPLG